MSKRRFVLVILPVGCVVLLAVLLGRLLKSQLSPSQSERSSQSVKLNVRLGWLVNANSAGQIVALKRGFYNEEGLDVIFHEGGIADPSVKTVAAGADELGFANGPDLVISARAAGVPLKIIAVIQHSGYHAFMVRENSGIFSPTDWVGRRVGTKFGSPTFLYYLQILNKLGINRSSINEVPLGYDVRPFLAGEVDVLPGAKNNEAITLELSGVSLRLFSPADFGIPTMGNVLFTTETMLREHGDIVRRFIRATMKGWEWCRSLQNRDGVLDYLLAYNPKLERRKEQRALEETLRLVGDGKIDTQKLENIIINQARFGGLTRPMPVDELTAIIPTE